MNGIILDPMALWGVEMSNSEMWALIMSAHSMRKALDAIRAEADEALLTVRRQCKAAERELTARTIVEASEAIAEAGDVIAAADEAIANMRNVRGAA